MSRVLVLSVKILKSMMIRKPRVRALLLKARLSNVHRCYWYCTGVEQAGRGLSIFFLYLLISGLCPDSVLAQCALFVLFIRVTSYVLALETHLCQSPRNNA